MVVYNRLVNAELFCEYEMFIMGGNFYEQYLMFVGEINRK